MNERDRTEAEPGALTALAYNLRWAWDPDAQALFRELAPKRFAELEHNPVALLAEAPEVPVDIEQRAEVLRRRLQAYLASERTWADTEAHVLRARPVAYFSMEFGIHESLALYSGGLGVLAGDHLKSASDLGIPLVGVGLMYSEGYFRQDLDGAGYQVESYVRADPERLPMRPALRPTDGQAISIVIETNAAPIHAKVWELAVGRVKLLLLDTDVEGNSEADRRLTSRLYGGDAHMRIRQELLLGVGGVRALTERGIEPGVLHLNEGHCAFAALELARQRMHTEGIGFGQAATRVARQTVFTTHTPVPAGHDRFERTVVEEHLGPLRDGLALDEDGLMNLGRVLENDEEEPFCMTVLALRMSCRANGVSLVHGQVSRHMWHALWPNRAEHDVPIGHITNGVHVPTWMAPAMRDLMARYAGEDWLDRQPDLRTWEVINDVDDVELWTTHQRLKRELIAFARERSAAAARARGEPQEIVSAFEGALSEDTLLMGFARRFATYKRATLLMSDLDALDRLVNHGERPITLVFAGKAHPNNDGGKKLIAQVHQIARDSRFRGRVVFLEGYDIDIGRRLVQGVDVWLNNPRRPLEASGTSGQKVVLNGGLNCSVLDGWWAEAWDGLNGFAIGRGLVHRRPEEQDRRDYEDLLRILEQEVAPLYYARRDEGAGALPHGWIHYMKRSIRTLSWRYNSDRMLADYVRHCYLPAAGAPCAEMGYR